MFTISSCLLLPNRSSRKHEKRHVKPYSCTFPSCTKKFGSKNDWKRHENSQHFQLDVWKCDVQHGGLPSEVCRKVFRRQENFKLHLQTFHGMEDRRVLESKLESCRIGRNYEARFWCGFCDAVVESKQKGLGAWNERFDHIDNHFVGRNNLALKEICDWKDVDPDQPQDLLAPDSDDSDQSPSLSLLRDSTQPTTEHPGKLSRQVIQKRKPKKKAVDSNGRAVKRRRAHEYRCFCVSHPRSIQLYNRVAN